jgi:hypothetical protein
MSAHRFSLYSVDIQPGPFGSGQDKVEFGSFLGVFVDFFG